VDVGISFGVGVVFSISDGLGVDAIVLMLYLVSRRDYYHSLLIMTDICIASEIYLELPFD